MFEGTTIYTTLFLFTKLTNPTAFSQRWQTHCSLLHYRRQLARCKKGQCLQCMFLVFLPRCLEHIISHAHTCTHTHARTHKQSTVIKLNLPDNFCNTVISSWSTDHSSCPLCGLRQACRFGFPDFIYSCRKSSHANLAPLPPFANDFTKSLFLFDSSSLSWLLYGFTLIW